MIKARLQKKLENGFWFPQVTVWLDAIYKRLPGTIFGHWLNDVPGASELYQLALLAVAVLWVSFLRHPIHPLLTSRIVILIGVGVVLLRITEIMLFTLHWIFSATSELVAVRRSLAGFLLNLVEIGMLFAIMSTLSGCSAVASSPWALVYHNFAAVFKVELAPYPPSSTWCGLSAHYQLVVGGVVLTITVASLVGGVLRGERKVRTHVSKTCWRRWRKDTARKRRRT